MVNEEKYLKNLKYADISRALSRDFLRVFCVNTETSFYVEYRPHEKDEALDVLMKGYDFNEVVYDLKDKCYMEDFDTFCIAFTKDNVMKVLSTDSSFSMDYRTMVDDNITHLKLKAVRIDPDDPAHILVGISNNDAHMRRLAMYESAMENELSYADSSEAMASDYSTIFCADLRTGRYKEYRPGEMRKGTGEERLGKDFFGMMRKEFASAVCEEDREAFLQALNKEAIRRKLAEDGVIIMTFHAVYEGSKIYIRMKITGLTEGEKDLIVVGLSDVDAYLKRIESYQQIERIAYKDSLTGVKSKYAYLETERSLNDKLQTGMIRSFAVVVCDVNGLKKINDTQGHQAGDDYLRKSCKMVCDVFDHSPVYRVGGDEFAALLTGSDYENRYDLIHRLHKLSADHIGTEEAVVSGGLAEYDPEQDSCVRDIFERADEAMYKDKQLLKSLGAVVRDDGTDLSQGALGYAPAINARKHILIADDLEINREIMGNLLEDDYEILYACDGVETLEMLRRHKDEIALLLLDLYMPRMTGREVIREMQIDEDLMSIPVIMMTVARDAELDSLRIGAMDFISKPYPDIEIVKARISKCIELSETRNLIRNTQWDKLTGLYNLEYFIQYVKRFDHQHKDLAFDALVCDIKNFHAVNETYGRQFGDRVLRSIGRSTRRIVRKTGGLGCRQGGDTFLFYCPHRNDYEQLIERFKADLLEEEELADKVDLRIGIFLNANKEMNIEERFACAKSAATGTADDPDTICGYYDPPTE